MVLEAFWGPLGFILGALGALWGSHGGSLGAPELLQSLGPFDPLSSFPSIAIKLCVGRAHQRERLHYGASDSLIGLGRK